MSLKIWRALPIGVVLLMSLAGCADDASDLRAWIDEQRKMTPSPVAVPQAAPDHRPLAYRADSPVDPFDSFRLEPAGRDGAELAGVDPRAALPALERQPLEGMVMVGVVDRAGERVALLRIEGALQMVRAGQRLGVHGGTVVQISERSITVSEPVQDALGRAARRTSILILKETKP